MSRFFLTLGSVSIALLVPCAAFATVHEPNGLAVPQPAPAGETSLNVFFGQRGEAIDWQADAQTTPHAFSPLCGFTATFVLNDAGSHFGLAWYNDTGAPPAANNLHVLVPAGSPVGTMFNGTAIKNDPAYTGGLVGFALVGGETHYTNPAYDNVCTGCNPAGPWITALMYPSKNTPNAYYICFEDGGTNATSWNNDGDFNDDVFFLTGITCSGGGQPCDTGKPGICAAGITQCTPNGVVCQQLSQPGTETCNGLDDNCNGKVDEGPNICPTSYVCEKGMCVKSCSGGEFACPGTMVCNADGFCVDPTCATVTCPSGKVCVQGLCKAPCDGVVCPYPDVCRVGACVDPCAGVTCSQGSVCDAGVCTTRCDCLPCATGKACNSMSGLCIEPTCVGKQCGAGTHCVAGACVDDCMGAMCPTGEACMNGTCVPIPAAAATSSSTGTSGFTTTASGASGSGSANVGGTGAGGAASTSGSGAGGGASSGKGHGCGCRVASRDDFESSAWLFGAVVAGSAIRRRRTTRRPPRNQ